MIISTKGKRDIMKASELIEALKELIDKHGDVKVLITSYWTGSVRSATYNDEDVSRREPYIELN